MNITWNTTHENQSSNKDNIIYHVNDAAVVSSLVVVIWTLLANGVIVVCFIINRNKIWPSFSKQVLCLSVTDIVVGLSALPLTILPFLSTTLNYGYCSVIFCLFYGSQCASLYQIFGICVHRCIIISKTSRINEQGSGFRFSLALALSSWILSITVNALLHVLFGNREVEINQCQFIEIFKGKAEKAAKFLFIVYFVPFILTNILYVITCLQLRYILKKVFPVQVNENEASSSRISRMASRTLDQGNGSGIRAQRKIIKTVGSLLLIFNICTIPLIGMFLIENRYHVSRTFKFIVSTMFVLNSAMNPFVYALRTSWLKLALKQILRDSLKTICPCKTIRIA